MSDVPKTKYEVAREAVAAVLADTAMKYREKHGIIVEFHTALDKWLTDNTNPDEE